MFNWIFKGLLIGLLLTVLPHIWAVLATLALLYMWPQQQRGQQESVQAEGLARLVELHRTLEYHYAKGDVDEEDYRRVVEALFKRYGRLVRPFNSGTSHRQRLEQAWSLLWGPEETFSAPPWQLWEAKAAEREAREEVPAPILEMDLVTWPPDEVFTSESKAPVASVPHSHPVYSEQASVDTRNPDEAFPSESAAPVASVPHSTPAHVEGSADPIRPAETKPKPPGIWGRRAATLSKAFREMALPFLGQNIGWFIGGFCLVSGSIFLVRYSEGFFKGLAVFASLIVFSLLFTWGGYQIRKHRSEQMLSSNVLLILGVLLIPPTLAAGTRLVADSSGHLGFIFTALLLELAAFVIFSFTVRLSSGLLERRLPVTHSRLYMLLAAIQCALPLSAALHHWSLIAVFDGATLALLAFGVLRHGHEWVNALFIERRRTTYYAVGSLMFAAVVSFVHVHWASELPLPRGYGGVFLLALTFLLLIADVQLKKRIADAAWVGRFTFVIYGLSTAGIMVGWGGSAAVPATLSAFTLTLIIATLLYWEMVRRYLSVAPLYLLAASASALYGMTILVHLPAEWHFLACTPLLWVLWQVRRFADRRQSQSLSLAALRLALGLGGLSIAWSLVQGGSSLASLISALLAAALLRAVQYRIYGRGDWEQSPQKASGYLQNGLVAAALGLAPAVGDVAWSAFFSGALLGLGTVWGLLGWRKVSRAPARSSVMIDSALAAIVSGMAIALLDYPGFAPLVVAYGATALLLSMALALRLELLVYASMAAAGLGFGLYKFGYALPTHKASLFIALPLLWGGIRALEAFSASRIAGYHHPPRTVRLFGRMDLAEYPGWRPGVLLQPLKHALWALWALGLLTLGKEGYEGINGTWGLCAAGLGTVSLMLAGQYAMPWLFSIAWIVLLAGGAAFFPDAAWIALAIGWAGLIAWLLAQAAASRKAVFWSFLGWELSAARMEMWVRIHALPLLIGTASVTSFFFVDSYAPAPLLLGAALAPALFFALAGAQQRQPFYTYLLVALFLSVGWGEYGRAAGLGTQALFSAEQISMLFPGLALAGGLSFVALGRIATWRALYALPVRNSAALLFTLGLYFTFAWWSQSGGAPWQTVSFVLLAMATLPITDGLGGAPRLRGIGVPLLLSAGLLSLGSGSAADPTIFFAWGSVLWFVGQFVLPLTNRKWPTWCVTRSSWPMIGLAFVAIGYIATTLHGGLRLWPAAFLTAYLLALYGTVSWTWLPMAVANAFLLIFPFGLLESLSPLHPHFVAATLLWLNTLLGIIPLIRRNPRLWWWNVGALVPPLLVSSGAVLGIALVYTVGFTVVLWLEPVKFHYTVIAPLLLLPLTWMHLLKRTQTAWAAHGVLLSLANAYLALTSYLVGLPFAFATLFASLALLRFRRARSVSWQLLDDAASRWLPVAFAAAIAALVIWGWSGWADYLAMTAISLGAFFAGGGQYHRSIARLWLAAANVAILLPLHLIWLRWTPENDWLILVPWWSLQNVLLVFALISGPAIQLHGRLFPHASHERRWNLAPWLSTLAVVQLAVHGIWLLVSGVEASTIGGLTQLAGSAAAVLCFARLLTSGRLKGGVRVYLMALTATLVVGYLRLLWFGPVAMTVWDTGILIAASFIVMTLQRATASDALYRVSMLLPTLALLTIPFQLASLHASITLLAIGSYYLVNHWRNETKLPLYLGLLALNAAAYLWVPGLVANTHLLQIYTVPAAITVLMMLQLHAFELKPSVRHAGRLGALSVLYASAALDLFLKPGMGVFVLALALSLGGVVIGFSLQVRAFIYSGTVFLIMVVAGQLTMNYPEGNLAKGALLMAGGAGITGAMIWINIKREALLQKLQQLRMRMADWE